MSTQISGKHKSLVLVIQKQTCQFKLLKKSSRWFTTTQNHFLLICLKHPKLLVLQTACWTSFMESRKQCGPSQLSLDLSQFWPSLGSAWPCTGTRKMMMAMLEDSSGLGLTTKIDRTTPRTLDSAAPQNKLFCSVFPPPFRHFKWEVKLLLYHVRL